MWIVMVTVLLGLTGYLAWTLAVGKTETRILGELSTQAHVEYANDRIDEKCLSLDLIIMRDCVHEEMEAALDHARSNQDLEAQQKMALFTMMMGWTAVGGLLLGLGSIIFIRLTFVEMGRTNQIMRNEQRPWLSFEIQGFGDFQGAKFTNGKKSLLCFPKVEIENHGKSPATDIRFNLWIWEGKRFDDQIARDEMFPEITVDHYNQRPIIFPGKKITWENRGAGHGIRELAPVKNSNAENTFWFVATVAYQFEGQWFYTSQVHDCNAVELSGKTEVYKLNPNRLLWGDVYT